MDEQTNREWPRSLEEWLCYVKQHEDAIMVFHKDKAGKREPTALKDVPAERWAHYMARWIEQGFVPSYVKKETD